MRGSLFCLLLALSVASCDKDCNPVSPSGGSGSSAGVQVWVTPNIGSDVVGLVAKPDDWKEARSRIDVLKLYPGQVESGGCVICGNNNLKNFMDVVPGGAFRWFNNEGIVFALEAGAVKDWNCGGRMPDENVESASNAIRNIEMNGGRVRYLAIDEPFTAIKASCEQSIDTTAGQVKYYINRLNSMHPRVSIGLIEAYPYLGAEEIEEMVISVEKLGVHFPFLHIDGHRHGALANYDIPGDLRRLRDFSRGHGMDFGAIIWGDDGGSNQGFTNEAIMTAESIRVAIGSPDHLLIQSWSEIGNDPFAPNSRIYPDNIPEDKEFTFMWLVNQQLVRFGIR
ncbi:MAG: hypothetical protein HYT62_01405 [Candidatus Yanofskybacteria bacterium]|nr:hypothetical protein [Candidatus Yanofskybacteria bacterium]